MMEGGPDLWEGKAGLGQPGQSQESHEHMACEGPGILEWAGQGGVALACHSLLWLGEPGETVVSVLDSGSTWTSGSGQGPVWMALREPWEAGRAAWRAHA